MFGDPLYVRLDPIKVRELLQGSEGPVYREMFTVGELLKVEAKKLCGVSEPAPGQLAKTRGVTGITKSNGTLDRRYKTSSEVRKPGTLRDSIIKRMVTGPQGPTVQVGSDDPVALWHHEGTQPHIILPVKAPRLVFYSKAAGRVVFAIIVHHPGTKPNRFLLDALRAIRARY